MRDKIQIIGDANFVIQFKDTEIQLQYSRDITQISNQFHQLPHSEEHQKSYFIHFTLNGDIEDMPNSLEMDIQKCCCYTYRQDLENYFEQQKQKWIKNLQK